MNIVLIGFMGTGKSVVGKRLASRLGCDFFDTDEQVAAAAGRPIPEIFASEGEAGFRDRETATLRSLVDSTDSLSQCRVVATGGGIMGRPENVGLLRRIGPLVCLTARPDVILERTRPWKDRPMLANAPDPRAFVEQLLVERASRYALAEVTIDTSDRDVDQVVDEICRALT